MLESAGCNPRFGCLGFRVCGWAAKGFVHICFRAQVHTMQPHGALREI